jgi:hypothetical protein
LEFGGIGGIIETKVASSSMTMALGIFDPVPPSTSPLDGFFCLAIGLLGLLFIPVQVRKMDFSKQWPKLALELAILLFLVVAGLVIISRRL